MAEQGERRRGRETAADMIRSLGIVMVLVVGAFWLAQPPDGDTQEVRVIDPAVEVRSFTRAVPSAVVPGALPAEWLPTVARYSAGPDRLRVGYNTPRAEYAEYFASTGRPDSFLVEATGKRTPDGTVEVAGSTWQQVRAEDGGLSIYRTVDGVTVVIGSVRSTATLDELAVLAGSLTRVAPRT